MPGFVRGFTQRRLRSEVNLHALNQFQQYLVLSFSLLCIAPLMRGYLKDRIGQFQIFWFGVKSHQNHQNSCPALYICMCGCVCIGVSDKTVNKHMKGDFPGGTSGKEPVVQCRRLKGRRFDAWGGKIPWRRALQPTPVFLPGESHGQSSLAGYRAVHDWRDLAHILRTWDVRDGWGNAFWGTCRPVKILVLIWVYWGDTA